MARGRQGKRSGSIRVARDNFSAGRADQPDESGRSGTLLDKMHRSIGENVVLSLARMERVNLVIAAPIRVLPAAVAVGIEFTIIIGPTPA